MIALERAPYGMTDDEQHDRAADCNQYAVEIKSGDALSAQGRHDPAANNSSDDSKHDIEDDALTLPVHDLASNEACNQAENDPGDDRHTSLPLEIPSTTNAAARRSSLCHASW